MPPDCVGLRSGSFTDPVDAKTAWELQPPAGYTGIYENWYIDLGMGRALPRGISAGAAVIRPSESFAGIRRRPAAPATLGRRRIRPMTRRRIILKVTSMTATK